ncbi:chorion class CB protein PC404-like [Cydia amplana]|uniref:chorion class CB protein PC404-like n=1 Tax=Cydia amplana TaxID=1869771 RepID=UPI002FE5D286
MLGKIGLVLCLQAALLQSISAQKCGCSCDDFDGFSKTATYSTGGPVTVTCSGPLSSNGVSLLSELSMEGSLDVKGSMPFLSAVALEGTIGTTGCGTVAYGCGDGNIVIVQENGNPSGSNAASKNGLSLANLAQCGCRYR